MKTGRDGVIDWHATVTVVMTHSFTVRAEDVFKAQAQALASLPDRKAQHVETTIDIEQGVR